MHWFLLTYLEPVPVLQTGSVIKDSYFSLNTLDPIQDAWNAVDLSLAPNSGATEIRDYMVTNAFAPVFSPRAVSVLKPVMSQNGVFCKVTVEGQDGYQYFRCNNVLDVLDLEQSDFLRNPMVEGQIIRITNTVFRSSEVAGHVLRLPQRERVHELFVSENVRELVECNQLTGFRFLAVELI